MNIREVLRGVRMRTSLEKTQFPITVEALADYSNPPNVFIGEVDISPDVISVDIDTETPIARLYTGDYAHTGERYIMLTLRLRVKQAICEEFIDRRAGRPSEEGSA